MKQRPRTISPLQLSLLHLLPSLLLLALIIVGFVSLASGQQRAVLGAQSVMPQVVTKTVEDRINELTEIGKKTNSEAVESAKKELAK